MADASRGLEVPAPRLLAGIRERWRADVAVAWRAFWLGRLVVWVSGVGAYAAFGTTGRERAFDPLALTAPGGDLLDALLAPAARWDSVWFATIADGGYDDQRAAFFPLYPLLLKLAGGGMLAGMLLSCLAFVAALAVLHRLAALELGPEAARLTVFSLALFPGSLFFSAVYSESLFLLVSVAAIYAARTDRWAAAGALGALAAATRSAGLLLVVPLALLCWQRRGQPAWIALVPLGLAAFCGFLALDGGDALAPFDAQETWYRHFAGPFVGAYDGFTAAWEGARQLLSGSRFPVYFQHAGGDPYIAAGHNLKLFVFLVAAVAMLPGTLRRLPPAYGAYALAALALPLSWPVGPQPLMSFPRFMAVVFPLFMWLGLWLARGGTARRTLVLSAFGAGLALFSAQFATWHWVA